MCYNLFSGCLVPDLLTDEKSNFDNNDTGMIDRQETFHSRCNDRCKEVNLESVIRMECSKDYYGIYFFKGRSKLHIYMCVMLSGLPFRPPSTL